MLVKCGENAMRRKNIESTKPMTKKHVEKYAVHDGDGDEEWGTCSECITTSPCAMTKTKRDDNQTDLLTAPKALYASYSAGHECPLAR